MIPKNIGALQRHGFRVHSERPNICIPSLLIIGDIAKFYPFISEEAFKYIDNDGDICAIHCRQSTHRCMLILDHTGADIPVHLFHRK